MKSLKFKLLIASLTFNLTAFNLLLDASYKAVILSPVADAGIKKFDGIHEKSALEVYENLPCSPESGSNSCVRAFQLLFNETVEVLNQDCNEVECKICNGFYEDDARTKINTFWLLKKNLMDFNLVTDRSAIPDPISNDFKKLNQENILTLILPWHNSFTNEVYSVGTRFIRKAKDDTEDFYCVKFYNFIKNQSEVIFVPKKLAIVDYPKELKDQKGLFIQLMQTWASLENVAYVWGGSSLAKTYDDNFELIADKKNEISFWSRPKLDKTHTGFDCSSLILRAAQISGIPYFYKTTNTLSNNLTKLCDIKDSQIELGDLIWHKGHVMAVSDIKNNKIVEAVGYSSGFGKLLEHSIDHVFKDIKNFDDLLTFYKNKQSIKRLNKAGQVTKEHTEWQIFRIL